MGEVYPLDRIFASIVMIPGSFVDLDKTVELPKGILLDLQYKKNGEPLGGAAKRHLKFCR